jgi:TolB-like protein
MKYLSDGITASIINNLSQLNRLRVLPRTTAFDTKEKSVTQRRPAGSFAFVWCLPDRSPNAEIY